MTIYELFSFAAFTVINIGSLIAATIFGWWYFVKLKDSRTNLRDFIGSVALAKLNLWGWSAANMWAMVFSNNFPPVETVPFRILWIVVIYLQIRAITKVRPTLSAEMIAEMIAHNRKNKILILEDDNDVAEIYKLALSDFGYNVVIAGTGSYALSVLDWQMPKICIVDIRLPDMTGHQFLIEARKKGYSGPAIAVSGAPLDSMDGFIAFIQKPFKPGEIVAAVERYMER